MAKDLSEVAFLLVPEFSAYGLVPLAEALRIANQNSGQRLFHWRYISHDGSPVQASSGLVHDEIHGDLGLLGEAGVVFVCAGNHPLQYSSARLHAALRRFARFGGIIGAIDGGAFILAEAGLLNGHSATVHWEMEDLFVERYPQITLRRDLFVLDGSVLTCAGGIASLDMALWMIEQLHGKALAQVVANGFVYPFPRNTSDPQSATISVSEPERLDPRLRRMVDFMHSHVESPLSVEQLSRQCGISRRHLSRLCREQLGRTPENYYLQLRIEAAKVHLFHSAMSIKTIGLKCGFSTSQDFSRAFRRLAGVTPRVFRDQYNTANLALFR